MTGDFDDEGCEACDAGMRCPVHMAITAGTDEDQARRPTPPDGDLLERPARDGE